MRAPHHVYQTAVGTICSVGAVYAYGDSNGGDNALDKLHNSSAGARGVGPRDDAPARGGRWAGAP
jgi:hypothetical protein